MKKHVERIFKTIDLQYLIRAYIISIAICSGLICMAVKKGGGGIESFIIIIMGLLYPFSKLVYDEITRLLMGDNVIFMNAIILLIWKVSINIFLFVLSPFLAPFGLLYLWFRGKRNEQ